MTKDRINPSILSADFVNLEKELQAIKSADLVHVDVMDNHFVPNLTMGPPIVKRIQEVSPIPLDVHLMIENVDAHAPEYADLGAFSVTFHAEATERPVELAREIRKLGARAGIALKPGTDIESYLTIMHEFDQLLIMTVEPGFGGQKFIETMMPKLRVAYENKKKHGLDIWLQVDGGVTTDTIGMAKEAGADTFVAGSAVFNGVPSVEIANLRLALQNHSH